MESADPPEPRGGERLTVESASERWQDMHLKVFHSFAVINPTTFLFGPSGKLENCCLASSWLLERSPSLKRTREGTVFTVTGVVQGDVPPALPTLGHRTNGHRTVSSVT
jgi:hypothetical protein